MGLQVCCIDRKSIHRFLNGIQYQSPDCPEGKLFFAVFAQAVQDACSMPISDDPKKVTSDQRSAIEYLLGDMPHISALGIDVSWVRRKMLECGILRATK